MCNICDFEQAALDYCPRGDSVLRLVDDESRLQVGVVYATAVYPVRQLYYVLNIQFLILLSLL